MYIDRAIQNIHDETEFNKIYKYEDLLKVAKTSNHPSIITYLRLIELRDNAIKRTGRNLLKSEWAKLTQSSIRGLEISVKLGLIEWAKVAHISLENLDWTEKRAIQARRDLRDFYQYLVTDLVDKYQNCGLDILQVTQQGKIGLDYAIDNYNRTKKVQFLKFANYWIEYKIIKAIELTTSDRFTDRTLTTAQKITDLTAKIKDTYQRIYRAENRYPSISRIAFELDISEQKVIKIILDCEPAQITK